MFRCVCVPVEETVYFPNEPLGNELGDFVQDHEDQAALSALNDPDAEGNNNHPQRKSNPVN